MCWRAIAISVRFLMSARNKIEENSGRNSTSAYNAYINMHSAYIDFSVTCFFVNFFKGQTRFSLLLLEGEATILSYYGDY